MPRSRPWSRWLPHWLTLGLALTVAAPARAQDGGDARAKALFNAGAQAYKAGDFLAAAQAFRKAYDIEPRPGLLFSAGQALRRQFVASNDPKQARLAIKFYREYLGVQKKGGRRLEAAQAVSELIQEVGEGGAGAMSFPTRLMVTSPTPGAVVRIDGGPVRALPFNEQIDPGEHAVTVMASGFEAAERKIVAQKGDIVPLDLPLDGEAPVLDVIGADGSDVEIDGKPIGTTPFQRPVAVSEGTHFVTVTQTGAKPYAEELDFAYGSTTEVELDLPMTNQRRAAWGVMATGGLFAIGAAVQGGLAAAAQREAVLVRDARDERNITEEERQEHNDNLDLRDRLAAGAIATAGLAVLVTGTGLLLYVFDDPEVEPPRSRRDDEDVEEDEDSPDVELMGAAPIITPTTWGIGVMGRF